MDQCPHKSTCRISQVAQQYNGNYAAGYIGFSFPVHPGFVSHGITYLTRWDRMSDIRVSHAFIVENAEYCIEADMDRGVIRTPLAHYFGGAFYTYFRKPSGYSIYMAGNIVRSARMELGKPYDKALIAAHLLIGSRLGHCFNRLWKLPERLLCTIFNRNNHWICSELAAHCLRHSPFLSDQGILRDPPDTITPQELFEDNEVFTTWHKDTP
jgi:hypothetical protein